MNYTSLIFKIVRYLAQALAIYLIFRFMPELTTGNPNTRLNDSDVLIITIIIMLIYILFENLCNFYGEKDSGMTTDEKKNFCSSVCSVNHEPMTNMNNNMNNMNNDMNNINNNMNNINNDINKINNNMNNNNNINNDLKNINNDMRNIDNDMKNIDNDMKNINNINNNENRCHIKKYYLDQMDETDMALIKLINERHNNPNFVNCLRRIPGDKNNKNISNLENIMSNMNINKNMINDNGDYNHVPTKSEYTSCDYGYSYLPPSQWYPTPPFPPVCIADKKCPVCPVYTTGTPMDVKEWRESCKPFTPDDFATKYQAQLDKC